MAKFNGRVTLTQFKKAAVSIEVFYSPDDMEWRAALERARTWKQAANILPSIHPMRAIASRVED